MLPNWVLLAAPMALLVAAPALRADGTAPLRFRHAGGTTRVYFCVDKGGRGAPCDKVMTDGRPGTLLVPGHCVRVPGTNLFDRPTLRIYSAEGVEIYSKLLLLLPIGGERWEQVWDGAALRPDDR
jgi:hypothetical protein